MKFVPYVVCAPTIIAAILTYVRTRDFTDTLVMSGVAAGATFIGFITIFFLIGSWISK